MAAEHSLKKRGFMEAKTGHYKIHTAAQVGVIQKEGETIKKFGAVPKVPGHV